MMAKRPEDRYSAPAAVADALSTFCSLNGPAPAVLASLIDQPAPFAEPGWTLAVNSTVVPPSSSNIPILQASSAQGTTVTHHNPLLGEKTVLALPANASGSPMSQPTARAGKGHWLVLALSVVIVILAGVLGYVLWPKSGDKDSEKPVTKANGTGNDKGTEGDTRLAGLQNQSGRCRICCGQDRTQRRHDNR